MADTTNPNQEYFVLIPLSCLTQVWEKNWTFDDLFQIGILVSAATTNQPERSKQIYDLWEYGMLSNFVRKSPYQGNWMEEKIADIATEITPRVTECRFCMNLNFDLDKYVQEEDRPLLIIWTKIVTFCHLIRMDIKKTFDILYNGMTKLDYCKKLKGEEPCLKSSYELPPYILVSQSVIKAFAKLRKYSTDLEVARRLMFLGIASIIGKKQYMSTTSDMIKARMFGFTTPQELKAYYDDPAHESFRASYDKYTTRRRYDYMIKDLKIDGLLGEVPYKRRTIVSTRIKDDFELLKLIYKDQKSSKRAEVTAKLKEAQEKLRQMKKDGKV